MIEELVNKLFNDSIVEYQNPEEYTTIFRLPIELIDKKIAIGNNIINDLELLNNNEKEKISLYHNIFDNQTFFGETNLDLWSKYFTNDLDFLTDSQTLYKTWMPIVEIPPVQEVIDENIIDNKITDNEIYSVTNDIIHDDGFIDRFHYIDLPIFKDLNRNETVLQVLAYQNLSSPAFALVMPLLMMILPFFIIKIQGHEITLERYVEFLKKLLGNHILGQVFCGFWDAPIEKKVYMVISLGLFIFQVYNNINTCKNYYKNIKSVHDTLNTVRRFLTDCVADIDNYLKYSMPLLTYRPFNDELIFRREIITDYLASINKIGEYRFDFKKILELGYLMKCFYILNNDNQLTETIKWCFGFTGYIENISRLQIEIREKRMNFCRFIEASNEDQDQDEDKDEDQDEDKSSKKRKGRKSTKPEKPVVWIKNSYFAGLNRGTPVKNSVKLENNIIITGPNAAGKTTLLKSILYNIIISQQIGCGFYSKADMKLYDFIHCYINIPDTGDRDSLFQAECRTCREILTTIMENPDRNHFCVFDELYSGTNPYEAIASGYSYLDYLSGFENINFVLTTHYIGLCTLLEADSEINKNYYMEIESTSDNESIDYKYTYRLVPGISKIKGGIKVLRDLEYPDEIIATMSKSIETIEL